MSDNFIIYLAKKGAKVIASRAKVEIAVITVQSLRWRFVSDIYDAYHTPGV